MDHRTLAIICIAGSSLDVLGALYLAYDLLGGEHGPLRALTRGVTYGVLFAIGYGVPLGPIFGIAAGVTHGLTLAMEFSRAARGELKTCFRDDAISSTIRGTGHGIGAGFMLGPLFGLVFGALSAISQTVAYQVGIRPTLDYSPAPRLGITRRQMLAAMNRTVGYGLAGGLLCAYLAHRPDLALSFGIRIGFTFGMATGLFSSATPMVEWAADHVPERRMGVLGVGLILVGFGLQSVQYWLALLDVKIR
jgi:hypothetical protein